MTTIRNPGNLEIARTARRLIGLPMLCIFTLNTAQEGGICPYEKNPYYWQYHGEPVMLLGGSRDDNLFQIPGLEEHLDLMEEVGANYIRNTMSSRDEGNVQPFLKVDGLYDLSRWNPEYWDRFDRMLKWTSERRIFVQIEIWAFHDFYGEWEEFLPWNPRYNINYSVENTRLDSGSYGSYWETVHDFFMTVPELHNDQPVLQYQQAFVEKILHHALPYDHVLYCMTNEIFTQYPPEWGWYWASYIRKKSGEAGKQVYVAEMYQNHDLTHPQHRATLDHPEIYDFVDISQNSRQLDDTHWEKLQWVREYISEHPRPINHTKTYGSDLRDWSDGDVHGIERFWRNILGGAASVRFHRPISGIGLSEKARTQIVSARMLLDRIDIFRCRPDACHSLLSGRDPDEAYLAYLEGEQYAVHFPQGGCVDLTVPSAGEQGEKGYTLYWLDISLNRWLPAQKSVTSLGAGSKKKYASFGAEYREAADAGMGSRETAAPANRENSENRTFKIRLQTPDASGSWVAVALKMDTDE